MTQRTWQSPISGYLGTTNYIHLVYICKCQTVLLTGDY